MSTDADQPSSGGLPEPGDLDDALDDDAESPQVVDLEPPRMSDVGTLRQIYYTRRYLKKREKLLGDGYVQWFLVHDTFPRPRFIKPNKKSGGVPEYEHGGMTYLFPESTMMPSSDGMWTVVHKVGEAEPINLREPGELAIPGDVLKEYLERRVTSTPPSLFDTLDIDAQTVITLLISAIIAFALFNQFAGVI